jgi:hypothetical protein
MRGAGIMGRWASGFSELRGRFTPGIGPQQRGDGSRRERKRTSSGDTAVLRVAFCGGASVALGEEAQSGVDYKRMTKIEIGLGERSVIASPDHSNVTVSSTLANRRNFRKLA